MQKIKIAFIGFGRHARANLYPTLSLLGYELCAVATTKEESANKALGAHVTKQIYINYEEMLDKEKPDCVFVCTQPEAQIGIVKNCLKAGAHVFVEKNLGVNAKEAQDIAKLSQQVKKEVAVGFMKKFAPVYANAKAHMNTTEFGILLSLSQTFTSRSFVKSSPEYMLFAAIHYIDLLRFYMGEIKEVKGFETTLANNYSQAFTCISESGATASLYYVASPAWDVHVEDIYISGTNGYIATNGINKLRVHSKEQAPAVPQWQILSEKEDVYSPMASTGSGGLQNLYLNGFVGEIENFLKSVETNTTPVNNASENAKTMELYDLMVKSIS